MALRFVFNPFTHQFDAVTPLPAFIGFLTGDAGGPIGPDAGNNINITTGDGLTTTGTALTNNITISLDGYLEGGGTTIGAPHVITLISYPMPGTPAVYQFTVDIAGLDLTNPAGIGIHELATIRTNGAAATIVDTIDTDVNSEGPIVSALTYSGVSGNNFVVRAIGSPLQTINWRATAKYVRAV